jgi:group I intron endonuclease
MTGIYKITNLKGKIYIGQSINIEARKKVYRYFNSYKNSVGPVLTNSFKKYGWENHIFEIIEECSLEHLNKRETYWKQYFLDQVKGNWKQVLFCNLHDTGGGPLSEETKQKISKSMTGKPSFWKGKNRGEEFGEKISSHPTRGKKISEGNKGKLKPQTGIKLQGIPKTEQHKQNISNSSKGKTRNNKPILQYDLEGNFIKEWVGRTEAKKWLGPGDIAGCLSGKQKQAGGFIWEYKIL